MNTEKHNHNTIVYQTVGKRNLHNSWDIKMEELQIKITTQVKTALYNKKQTIVIVLTQLCTLLHAQRFVRYSSWTSAGWLIGWARFNVPLDTV